MKEKNINLTTTNVLILTKAVATTHTQVLLIDQGSQSFLVKNFELTSIYFSETSLMVTVIHLAMARHAPLHPLLQAIDTPTFQTIIRLSVLTSAPVTMATKIRTRNPDEIGNYSLCLFISY